jgi:hypothetical protein
MSLEINILDRKVYSQYVNGDNFTLNLSDYQPHLYGVVMNKVKVVHKVRVGWQSNATEYIRFTYASAQQKITRPSGSFLADGWSIGDLFSATASFGASSYTWTGNVASVTDTEMFINVFTGSAPADGLYLVFDIIGTTPIGSLQLSFNLIENSENVNYQSKVDGNEQVFYKGGIGTSFSPMIPLGTARSWVTGDVQVRKLSNFGIYQEFEIEHTFIVTPYYLDGELTNLESLLEPSLYSGTRSLKYVTKYEFRNTLANPNTAKTLEDSQLLGAVGWFNENYNGFNNKYVVSNVTGENLTAGVPSTFTARITDVTGSNPFSLNTKVGCYFSGLPTQDQYDTSTTPYADIWLYDHLTSSGGGTGIIQSTTSTFVNANTIDIEVVVLSPNTDITNFLIAYEVGADGSTNQNSDRVNLLGYLGQIEVSTDEQGLYELNPKVDFFKHNDNIALSGSTNYEGWIEDTFRVKGQFKVLQGATLNDFTLRLVAYNTSNGDSFELDHYTYPLTPNIVVSGGQILNFDSTMGYAVNSMDPFNRVRLQNAGTSAGFLKYAFIGAIKIDWQNWISLPGADTVFYEPTDLNNGLNHNASNYNLKQGYELRLFFDALVNSTTYRDISPTLEAYNYDGDSNTTPPIWTGGIKTYADAGYTVDITPNILENDYTYIEAEFNKVVNDYCVLQEAWGIIRTEDENQVSKQQIYELSSIYGASPTSPLESDLPSGLLEVVVASTTNVILKAKIKPMNTRQKFSARLGCECIVIPPPIGRVTNTYLGTTNQGDFTGTFHITEGDDVTPLQLGDEVTLIFRSGTNNYFLGEATFPYGANLATATPLVDNGFVANLRPYFASGSTLVNGGSYVFLKKPFAHNWHNTHTGAMAGINLGEEIIIEIRVKDTSTGQTSVNTDNTTNLRVLYNIINSTSGGSRGGAPTSVQSFLIGQWDNVAQVQNSTQLIMTLNGVTTTVLTNLVFPGNLFQPDTSFYEDRLFNGVTRNTPFGFTNATCPLPFATPLTSSNRWQKQGNDYITTRNLWQSGVQNETTLTTFFNKNIRAYQYPSGGWGNAITQCWLRIATNPGDDPNINFTQYNFAEPMNGSSNSYTIGSITFPSEGVYDTNAELHTNGGLQPASFARDQILVYSY